MKAILSEGFSSILLGVLLVSSINKIEKKADEKIIKTNEQFIQTQNLVRDGINQLEEKKKELYSGLNKEFQNDLSRWGAVLDKDSLSIRFTLVDESSPRVMFEAGSFEPTQYYKDLINDFCPRYYGVLKEYSKDNFIEEIKVEGHTSSDWDGRIKEEYSYYYNLQLSQNRAGSILSICLHSIQDRGQVFFSDSDFSIFRSKMTANGYSSSHSIKLQDGTENKILSRRVEFRVITSSDNKLEEISRSLK